jgi:tetrahydromethanopterin S-methyltransferase subunit G
MLVKASLLWFKVEFLDLNGDRVSLVNSSEKILENILEKILEKKIGKKNGKKFGKSFGKNIGTNFGKNIGKILVKFGKKKIGQIW